jgi:flagellar hook assembly protein FlgD
MHHGMNLFSAAWVMLLPIIACSPVIPDAENAGVCDRPTIVARLQPDSLNSVIGIEIYDYEKRLIQDYFSTIPDSLFTQWNFYWNAMDKAGNPVEPGRYTVKVSTVSLDHSTCKCSEVYVAKTSSPTERADSVVVVIPND